MNDDSCDTTQNVYFFWIEADRTGFEKDTTFQLSLMKPAGENAQCTICADTGSGTNCPYITCVIKRLLFGEDLVLPDTLDTTGLDFTLTGWETYVKPNPTVATNISCKSGFIKVGALLLVALLLF